MSGPLRRLSLATWKLTYISVPLTGQIYNLNQTIGTCTVISLGNIHLGLPLAFSEAMEGIWQPIQQCWVGRRSASGICPQGPCVHMQGVHVLKVRIEEAGKGPLNDTAPLYLDPKRTQNNGLLGWLQMFWAILRPKLLFTKWGTFLKGPVL